MAGKYTMYEALMKTLFAESQKMLMERLINEKEVDGTKLMKQLFETGRVCGMTKKEISRTLLEPVRALLTTN